MSGKQLPNLPPDTIEQLVRNQEKKLQIEAQQLNLQSQQDKHSFEFALKSLQVKAAGQEKKQAHEAHMLMIKTAGVLALALVVSLLIGFAIWSNHKDEAMEIIKALVYLASGAAAGYGYAKFHKDPDP